MTDYPKNKALLLVTILLLILLINFFPDLIHERQQTSERWQRETGTRITELSLAFSSHIGGSQSDNFPVTKDGFQANHKGKGDLFAVKLSADLSRLIYSSYLGGAGTDYGRTATIDANGNLLVAGMTKSRDWPTKNAFQRTYGGENWDAALAKLRTESQKDTLTAIGPNRR